MKSYSQAGQDLFVNAVLAGKRDGTFLDIGAHHSTYLSNTYALEKELGWRGTLIEGMEDRAEECRANRESKVICGDATSLATITEALGKWPPIIDYCSLDVDEAQVDALTVLLAAAQTLGVRFRVLTVETDLYRFGRERHEAILALLNGAGYFCIANEVKHEGCAFETFWVSEKLVEMDRASPFLSNGLDWREVLKLGGVTA